MSAAAATSTRPRTLGAAAVLVAVALSAATGCSTDDPPAAPNASASSTATPGGNTSPDPGPSTQEQSMTDPQEQSDRDAIIANFRARQQAMVDADTETLRMLSTPDSHAEHISGYNQPREEWFEQIESGYFDYHSIDNHSIEITFTGPTSATLVARSTIDVTIGGSRNTWRLESTADYVKDNGRWLSGDGSSRMY